MVLEIWQQLTKAEYQEGKTDHESAPLFCPEVSERYVMSFSVLPQWRKRIGHMRHDIVEQLGVCGRELPVGQGCMGNFCHFIDSNGKKYCPVLIFDAVKYNDGMKRIL